MTADRMMITGWSVVSPYGVGRDAFVDGVRGGRVTASDVDGERWQVPDRRASLVPGFDVREALGKKGTRSMDRVTGLAVTAVGRLIKDAEGNQIVDTGPDTGLVLGTTTGSAQSMMDFTRSSLTAEQPFYVDPSLFPNTTMNCAAGQCAIWYQLKGPNTTIAGGRTAGLTALTYGRRLLRSRRAAKVLVGGVEEYSNARSWLDFHSRGGDDAVLGEGCVILLMEPADTVGAYGEPLAELLAVETAAYLDNDPRPALEARVGSVLAQAGVEPSEVWAAVASQAPDATNEVEKAVLTEVFGAPAVDRITTGDLIGDTAAASVSFQIASLLAAAERDPEAAGKVVLVSSVDRSGTVGCAVLRLMGQV
ncbi:beta-ketoacyl synthase N-terminal-like domain-containing protein [Kutzneria sp. NPDC052558]|uniref:beta-ketoacyl synthase N-terminal-like domain-containing protein n=1 Tax=Kutzneria sp. NPDC052558 TaxID=3364121 RepID=UPI0037C62CDE